VTSESGLTAACQCRHMLPRLSQGVLLYCVSLTASVARSAGSQSVVSLVLTRLDYCNAVLARLPAYQLDRLQSAINAAARMIYRASRYDYVSSLLKEFHWLRVPERIEFKLCALVHKCLNGCGPAYLADSLQRVHDGRQVTSTPAVIFVVIADRPGALNLQDRKMTDNITGGGKCRTGN